MASRLLLFTTGRPKRGGVVSRTAAGIWQLADPKITLASAASLTLGAAAAAREGPMDRAWLLATVSGIFLVEVAKNASGEVFDFDSGADLAVAPEDRSPFSGGKRVLVDGLLTRSQTAAVATAAYVAAAALGLFIAFAREPAVLLLGVMGMALAFFYHAPPLKLSYRGWGELAVAGAYGPLIAEGTFLVQRGRFGPSLLWLSTALGLLIAAFLWINEFPDYAADRSAGKRNLVVRLGRARAARAFAALTAAAYAGVAALPLLGLPAPVLLGLAGAPLAFAAAGRLLARHETTREIVPAQAWTLLSFLLLAAGVGIGLLLS
jgi:1,4-dihydroxy-2-naphthoate octaprenyltransferase